jgi:hypothetical protein
MANQDDTSIGAPADQPETHHAGPESESLRAHARIYEEEAARVQQVTQALERESRRRLERAQETERPRN